MTTENGAMWSYDDAAVGLATWVQDRIPTIARAATDTIWAELPSYRATGLYDDVVTHVTSIFGVFTTSIIERRVPCVDDFAFTSTHASERVVNGISLIDFLQAFRIGQMVLWSYVLEFVRSTEGQEEAALSLVEHLMRTIELGSSAAATTYFQAQQYLVADQERIARDCLEDLLAGNVPRISVRLEAMRRAGLEPGADFVVIVCRATSETAEADLILDARKALARQLPGMLVPWRQDLVGLVPSGRFTLAALSQKVARAVKELGKSKIAASIGISSTHDEFTQTAAGLLEAQVACDHLGGRRAVQVFDDLSPLDYLVRRPDPTARRLIDPQLRAFIAEDLSSGSIYIETLSAYVAADMNATEAAAALRIHVNTMYYRLGRIAERTGKDLRHVEDVVNLLLAVRIASIDPSR
ncbi:PucR family transcriptional regulator [Rhodococcus sp. NPDC056960]|uniref:PucR family transcriptional regulator n=1 Tax=Rhodococcus sp. NPDC056960 TaxID=3345982 RepID=UPI0036353A4E